MTTPEPHRSELLAEIREGFAALADWCRDQQTPPPNPERAGAALDRLDAVIETLDEMIEQEGGE